MRKQGTAKNAVTTATRNAFIFSSLFEEKVLLPVYTGKSKRSLYCLGGRGRSTGDPRAVSVANDDDVGGRRRGVLCVADKTGSVLGTGTCKVLML